MACLYSKTSEAVIMALKDMFALHGIAKKVIADVSFNRLKFKSFASDWDPEIEVVTSSPLYSKSNGLVERNAVAKES